MWKCVHKWAYMYINEHVHVLISVCGRYGYIFTSKYECSHVYIYENVHVLVCVV